MDAFNDYFYLGKITKPHGYEGRVQIFLDTDEPEEYYDLDVVYLNISNKPVPFFIEDLNFQNNKAIAKFADIDDSEKVEIILNKDMYLPISMLPKLSGNKFYYHEVPGMMVVDAAFGKIGTIAKVLEYPNQALFQIFHKDNEVLIPISDDIIKDVDRTAKVIKIEAPEGLLDIYITKE